MIKRVNIWVSGRVQGVFFRQSTKKMAKEYGVLGSVKNLEDGRVEISAEAEEAQLKPFIDWCRKGPIAARVDHVEIIDQPVIAGELTSFNIL